MEAVLKVKTPIILSDFIMAAIYRERFLPSFYTTVAWHEELRFSRKGFIESKTLALLFALTVIH